MDADQALTFRISWVRPWLLAVTLVAVVLLPAAALGAGTGAWVGCALGLAVCSVAVLVPIAVTVRSSEWHVGAGGVGGRDNWHVYRRVDWSEIASVTPRLVPGYR